MRMNKSFLFIIIIVSFAVLSCTPVGYIHDNDSGVAADVEDFWTVPQRLYYTLGDNFVRASDLRAFASAQGIVESIPIDSVEINMIKNPAAPDERIPIVNGQYRLVSSIVGTGRKLVIVTYGGRTAEYSIEVRNPDGTVDPGDSGGSEGAGIGVIWR